MASSRETNTMAEGLQRCLNEISKMKTMPDSDLDFLVQLESMIVEYLRAPSDSEMPPPAPPGPAGGAMDPMAAAMAGPGAPPMMPPGPPGLPPGVTPGGAPMVPSINPDELRRVLGG